MSTVQMFEVDGRVVLAGTGGAVLVLDDCPLGPGTHSARGHHLGWPCRRLVR